MQPEYKWKGINFLNPTKVDSLKKDWQLISYEFSSDNNSYNTRIIPKYSLDIRKMYQRMFWKANIMHDS
jgi:hypothetical protein